MRLKRVSGFLIVFLLCGSPLYALAKTQTMHGKAILKAAAWADVTSAADVIELAPVRHAVSRWDRAPTDLLVIDHNGNENGIFWASELKGWLIALGIPKNAIRTRAAAISGNELQIELQPRSSHLP